MRFSELRAKRGGAGGDHKPGTRSAPARGSVAGFSHHEEGHSPGPTKPGSLNLGWSPCPLAHRPRFLQG